ncbi:hypothetical protein HYC85_006618 [Camellia sinensis]|uniref:Uncharacterized protein n=1 Tax=Camellia sinensis TaxID=4442 RepID=A0A7J7HLJ7_CAMSI|nr:hypothetical protein HYC85_006618 [Camellia sinensis]
MREEQRKNERRIERTERKKERSPSQTLHHRRPSPSPCSPSVLDKIKGPKPYSIVSKSINEERGTTSGTTLLYIVFLCSMTLGTILMCFLQKRDAKGEETLPDSSVSFYSSMVSMSKSVIAPLFDL